MDVFLPLFVITAILCAIFGLFFITGIPFLESKSFILSNIDYPIGFILVSIAIIFATIALSLVYNFLIPVFVIFSVIGYLLSIKYLPKFVLSQTNKVQNKISQSDMFPYYGTILLTTFWPLILLFRTLYSIFDILDIKIETPKKSVHRALNLDKGQ